MDLGTYTIGKTGVILSIDEEQTALRLSALGIFVGTLITKLHQAPLNGPVLIEYSGNKVAIRKKEASFIQLATDE